MRKLFPALLLVLVLPATAQGASLSVSDGVVRYEAAPGEVNQAGVRQSADGDVELYENGTSARPAVRVETGPGCRTGGEFDFVCEGDGVTAVRVSLGDRDDNLCVVAPIGLPVRYSGGAGSRDAAAYCGESPDPIALDNDGVADDGFAGRDDIQSDVELLRGTGRADTLGSGPLGANIFPGGGDDQVRGGPRGDRIEAAYVEDVGLEAGTFYRQGRDTVRCGGGQDFVLADARDDVAADCEATGRPAERDFLFTGSAGDDLMYAPYGWEPARMLAGRGDDRIETPWFGKNRIEAGPGNDRVREGYGARNAVFAGSGADVLLMRDEVQDTASSFNRDHVHCGSGFDRAFVDRLDRVARDCERVFRR